MAGVERTRGLSCQKRALGVLDERLDADNVVDRTSVFESNLDVDDHRSERCQHQWLQRNGLAGANADDRAATDGLRFRNGVGLPTVWAGQKVDADSIAALRHSR